MDKKEFEWKKWDEVKDTLKLNDLMVGYTEETGITQEIYALGVVTHLEKSLVLYDIAWGNFFEPDWVLSFEEFRK